MPRAAIGPPLATLACAVPVFTAHGDETRLHLVSRLCHEGPLSITRLADAQRLLGRMAAQWDTALGRLMAFGEDQR